MTMMIRGCSAAFLSLAIGACGASADDPDTQGAADGGVQEFVDAAPQVEADARPPQSVDSVYAHSADTLYRLDPETLEVQVIGAFTGCTSVVDIALDKDSNLYGTTFSGLYKIDVQTAACTEIATGAYPNSLSFVPAGVLDDNDEILVAYSGNQYMTIDIVTGEMKTVGSIGGGYASSGDIVSVEGGSTYLTASGPDCNDCLLEINPATGEMISNWGDLGFQAVFGLAYWGGTAYGFDDTGAAFTIDFDTGGTMSTGVISIPGAPAGLSFWGAGSTTQAPIID